MQGSDIIIITRIKILLRGICLVYKIKEYYDKDQLEIKYICW
jgi:hypothetical protein